MIKRILSRQISDDSKKGKVQLVLGARQVGKTTMMQAFGNDGVKTLLLNCDNYDDRAALTGKTSTQLNNLFNGYDRVFIDEAQRVPDIGLTLKIIGDLHLGRQVLVTGSSSLDLANSINEPATGRIIEYRMFPLSLREISDETSEREERRLLEQRMIYGLYPEIVTTPSDAKRLLTSISDNYLYKDLLSYKGIKKPDLVQKLVRALALQVGQEVSYNELAQLLGVDKETVESYIGLLEKCFVVFRLDSFSRNIRNEIKKGKKIYFWDNGIRNAVLSNFAPLELRADTGALWENLMISERLKRNAYACNYARPYFWRTHDQHEIDLIEEIDGCLSTFEFKFKPGKKVKYPNSFKENYPQATFEVITPENFWDFV